MESDPELLKVLNEAALEYLKTQDKEYFEREFSGELNEEGYLLKKDGTNSYTMPCQNIGGGKSYQWVEKRARELLSKRS